MTDREHYALYPAACAVQFQFWSAHMDALERHLSTKTWALAATMTVVLIAYPIARIVIPTVLHGIVPDVVRTVLQLI